MPCRRTILCTSWRANGWREANNSVGAADRPAQFAPFADARKKFHWQRSVPNLFFAPRNDATDQIQKIIHCSPAADRRQCTITYGLSAPALWRYLYASFSLAQSPRQNAYGSASPALHASNSVIRRHTEGATQYGVKEELRQCIFACRILSQTV